jgi:hypothetical protein
MSMSPYGPHCVHGRQALPSSSLAGVHATQRVAPSAALRRAASLLCTRLSTVLRPSKELSVPGGCHIVTGMLPPLVRMGMTCAGQDVERGTYGTPRSARSARRGAGEGRRGRSSAHLVAPQAHAARARAAQEQRGGVEAHRHAVTWHTDPGTSTAGRHAWPGALLHMTARSARGTPPRATTLAPVALSTVA